MSIDALKKAGHAYVKDGALWFKSTAYGDEKGRESERTVWPIAVSYWDTVRVVVAWCELRNAFRSFRTDRVRAADFLVDRYPVPRTRLTAQWRKEMRESIERGEWRKRYENQPMRP